MRFWLSRAKRERGAVFVAASQHGVSVFARLRVTARSALRAGLALAPLLWRVTNDRRRKRAKSGRL